MTRFLLIFFLAVLNAGCITIHTGNLKVGAEATFATHKTKPVCSWDQSSSRQGERSSGSNSQTCTETYVLGEQFCTRSWRQSASWYDAKGKRHDGNSSSYSSTAPVCRPLTSAERELYLPKKTQ